jgi:ABC-type multidrug transport system fused ATPase/permease subunit
LDTLDRVDDILMLENGKMVEFGSREALLTNRDSSYFRLRHTYGTVFKSTAQPILEMEMA